jgi:DNA-binding GntR family transcriptional regulator
MPVQPVVRFMSESLPTIPIKHRPLSEVVADEIIAWIMDGTLRAGEKINSEALSRKLGVSRTPVREALKSLEQTGLISSTPYVGTSVNKLLIEDIHEIYALREVLETLVVRRAVEFVTEADLQRLEDIQDRIEAEISRTPRDIGTIFKINHQFHMTMYAISGLRRSCELIEGLWASLSFFRLLHANNPTYGNESRKEHRAYIRALSMRDPKKLEKLILANLRRHAEHMPDTLTKYYASIENKSGKISENR